MEPVAQPGACDGVDSESFDIFVSYAHVDDQALSGAEMGWVSYFMRDLRVLLAQHLGRDDSFHIWFDQNALRGAHDLDSQIEGVLGSTNTILMLLSPGYFASDWCMQEQKAFIKHHDKDLEGRIVVAELTRIGDDQRARLAFTNRAAYHFWRLDKRNLPQRFAVPMPTASERDHFARLQDVAVELASCVKERRGDGGGRKAPRDGGPSIVIAEVTEDLQSRQENLVRRLKDAGLPWQLVDSHGLTTEEFTGRLGDAVAAGDLFVQLLGPFPGRARPGAPHGYAKLQYDHAVQVGSNILQWRDPALAISDVDDPIYRSLVEGESVELVSFDKFRDRVVAAGRLLREPAPQPQEESPPFLFVNADQRDYPLAQAILKQLPDDRAWEMPPRTGDPGSIRRETESRILECDDMMLIYGDSGESWLDLQLRYLRKMLPKRSKPLNDLIVVRTPPTDRPMPPVHLPRLRVVDWLEGMNPYDLDPTSA